jgi:Leucine-rich repeat (LRR) protein
MVCSSRAYLTAFFSTCYPANVNGNGLTGTLPPEINLWHELEEFAFINNEVGGSIPENFGFNMTSLRRVVLQGNNLDGTLPNDFLSESPLELLLLADNQFEGSIPTSLGNTSTLSQLILSGNSFVGNVPSEFTQYDNLGTLALSSNKLVGPMPEELFSMSNLERVHLDGNIGITGSIPTSIGQMSFLSELRLGGTGMGGPIPDEIFTLQRVVEINLSNAGFDGPLSEKFANFGGTLRRLILDTNAFTGQVPSAFANLTILSK